MLWIAFSSLYLRCYSQFKLGVSKAGNALVVNCFQFFIFAVLFTVSKKVKNISSNMLWIAFSSLYLRCYSQFMQNILRKYEFLLWIAFSSLYLRCYSQFNVLVCVFMPIVSCELLSVLYICGVIHSFKKYSRWILDYSCELLSVLYICGVIHSSLKKDLNNFLVVNCFQFFIFAVLFTVDYDVIPDEKKLWIAFSSLYLRCYSQLLPVRVSFGAV